jgi:hypothetical protein
MRRRMAMLQKGSRSMSSRCEFLNLLRFFIDSFWSFYQGLFNGKPFAIFQCKPIRVTNSQNLIDLTAELRLLSYGQYFANSFAKRAAAYRITIPGICQLNLFCLYFLTKSFKQLFAGIRRMHLSGLLMRQPSGFLQLRAKKIIAL